MADNAISNALEFLRAHHRGVLATLRADGSSQLSPVVAGVDGDGRVVISATEDRAKTKNVRARPSAAYCGFSDGFFGAWVQVEGPVEVIALPEAVEGLVALYRSIAGEHPDWDDYRAAMVRDRRCLIAITPERAVAVGLD